MTQYSFATNSITIPEPPVPTIDPQQYCCNYILTLDKSKYELAQYYYGCLFAPAITTLKTAIKKGNFLSWPGIETINFTKYVGKNIAHEKGHLDQERQNLRSTKVHISSSLSIDDATDDAFPSKCDDKCHHCYSIILPAPEDSVKGITYSDQTGRFPYQSSRGNKYIFVAYNYDANAFLLHLLKNRESKSLVEAWQTCHNRLTKNGHQVQLHILDNEISEDFVEALDTATIKYQRVAPGMHRVNTAERAIRVCKNHILSGLALCHKDYPIREWDRLIPQAELTINLLRNSRVNPSLSACAYLFGMHDFNKVPLAPP